MHESHKYTREFLDELAALMDANPDLPVQWIMPSEHDSYEWMGGWQEASDPSVSVATIARGWRHHFLIQGEDKPCPQDPAPDELKWYRAIVVRTY